MTANGYTILLASADSVSAEPVSTGITVLFGTLLALMVGCLAFEEKLHAKKSLITGVFAVVCLLLGEITGILPAESIAQLGAHTIRLPVYIPAIDWEVIAIIMGASLFVDVTSKSGIFSWIAIKLTKASGGDPLKLLIYYGVLTVVFSAVLNNVTAMIIVGSLTTVSLKKLGRSDKLLGFLLTEGLLTNVGGLLTLISSVPNIIVGNKAGISFISFFLRAAPFVVVATFATLWLAKKRFAVHRLETAGAREEAAARVAAFDENEGIPSRRFFLTSAFAFLLLIVALSTTSILPYVKDLGMGFVAMSFAVFMLIAFKHEVNKFYAALDWDLLGFFASLFVVINVMEHAMVLGVVGNALGALLGLGETLGTGCLLVTSALASSVTDNIPLAAVLAQILGSHEPAYPPDSPIWWAVVFGANLGGNLTPIGSASTLVAMTVIHRSDIKFSFIGFVKAAFPFAVMHLALAVVYVLIVL
ncbi:MAG: hypothetical protein GXP29_09985 [Planctomycetes bacterium]|nr:hypothetical protein [Planctomycetota bacterium]